MDVCIHLHILQHVRAGAVLIHSCISSCRLACVCNSYLKRYNEIDALKMHMARVDCRGNAEDALKGTKLLMCISVQLFFTFFSPSPDFAKFQCFVGVAFCLDLDNIQNHCGFTFPVTFIFILIVRHMHTMPCW